MDKNTSSSYCTETEKKPGCWSRFKSLFEDRGFDLEYEYNSHQPRTIHVLGENKTEEENKKIEQITAAEKSNAVTVNTLANHNNSTLVDGELTGVRHFYEQFATLGDDDDEDDKSDDLWRKSSNYRNRVSMRPSMMLTNIAEETSLEGDELEVVSIILF